MRTNRFVEQEFSLEGAQDAKHQSMVENQMM